jgi:hypothetical protein
MIRFDEYIKGLNESRYITHGVQYIKRTIPKYLDYYKLKYNLDINKLTDDFQIYIFNTNFSKDKFHNIIQLCEILGYFPSTMKIDDLDIFNEFKEFKEIKNKINNDKSYIDFIDFLKNVNIPTNFKEIYIQFESYQDKDISIENIPNILYHVYRITDKNKILRYGLCPKSKSKISYHPERIYLSFTKNDAEIFLNIIQSQEKDIYSILIINVDEELKSYLKIKIDPNFENGYYTNQNISPLNLSI